MLWRGQLYGIARSEGPFWTGEGCASNRLKSFAERRSSELTDLEATTNTALPEGEAFTTAYAGRSA